MEARTIAIANTRTQKKYTIESSATTLGELKAQLDAQGIDYYGMTFTEGISKLTLNDDAAQLPTNVMFKGAPTNNLVMLLTNPNKQIASGAQSVRKNLYDLVKRYQLQEAIKTKYGKNFTMVGNADLAHEIENCSMNIHTGVKVNLETGEEELVKLPKKETPKKANKEEKKEEEAPKSRIPNIKTAPHPDAVEWFYSGIKAWMKSNLLYIDDIAVLADLTTELYLRLKEAQPKITEDDIDKMIANL